ncbi:MAG: hypothetical protein AAF843_13560 [Bacteroidota bacterium]
MYIVKRGLISVSLLTTIGLWSVKAQALYTDYLWHSPEVYAQSEVDRLTLYYNSPPDNPGSTAKGIAFGSYSLDEKGKVQWASLAEISYGQWGSKDSVAFIHSGDTIIQQNWSAYLTFRDEKSIDFTYPEMPQFEAYEYMNKEVKIYNEKSWLTKSYTDYDTTYYHYNAKGQLLSKEIYNPEREDMGMNGRTLRFFSYNDQGSLTQEAQIISIPGTDKLDTLLAYYQYDRKQRLIKKIPASPIFSQPDTTFYEYDKDLLILEKTNQNTFIKREPVTYHFETLYNYSKGLLTEKKVTRDDELEVWEKYTYYPNGLIHQKKSLRLDTGEPVEVLTWEYSFAN